MKTREFSVGLIKFSLSTNPKDWEVAELMIIALIAAFLFYIEYCRAPISIPGIVVEERNIYDIRKLEKKCNIIINTTKGMVSDYYFGNCLGAMRAGESVSLKVGVGLLTHHLIAVHDSVKPSS